jgi:hypothetical protein
LGYSLAKQANSLSDALKLKKLSAFPVLVYVNKLRFIRNVNTFIKNAFRKLLNEFTFA